MGRDFLPVRCDLAGPAYWRFSLSNFPILYLWLSLRRPARCVLLLPRNVQCCCSGVRLPCCVLLHVRAENVYTSPAFQNRDHTSVVALERERHIALINTVIEPRHNSVCREGAIDRGTKVETGGRGKAPRQSSSCPHGSLSTHCRILLLLAPSRA